MKKTSSKRSVNQSAKQKPQQKKVSRNNLLFKILGLTILLLGLIILFAAQTRQDFRGRAAPSADLLANKNNQSFTGGGYTSEYHIYAAGLDWTKPVGLLMYTDGSGESGLKNPTGSYLMGGANGMIAVAKKHNMVLVTPMSPNKSCTDGSEPESCWYEGDSPGYAKWAEALITSIQQQYGIDKKRVAVGGYSSGATFTTGWWVPSGAAQRTMDDGVIVAISYGGEALMDEVAYSAAFKSNVHMNWNGGDADESIGDVRSGNAHYTKAGFQTSLDVIPGKGHDRSGEFGGIMDAMITKHVPPATGSPSTGNNTNTPSVSPTYFCGGSIACVPSTSVPVQNPTDSPDPNVNQFPQISTNPNAALSPIPMDGGTNTPNTPDGEKKGLIAAILAFFVAFLTLILDLFR